MASRIFLNQELNPWPLLHWECRVLTTGPPEAKKKKIFFLIRLGLACMLRGKCQMRGWTEDEERRG